ncbi:nucleolar complex protein 4 homolog A isoform X2 [Zootermopsis nevadensis]|uniref:nucleolar complex protein 4 homolog A isoform X2 n=1 Tax=Zootermopsis nevadensis TaxID=136037 RepID=UPI000B8EC64C|nr:nucleolar complex protein 4 homolog A isoform X2 [Zootermopsis nevadensis]
MLSKELRTQASEFLKSRKNANNLISIISLLEHQHNQKTTNSILTFKHLKVWSNEGNVQPCILALEMIFTEVLKRREICRDFTAAANEHEVNAETKYRVWLLECYEDTFMRLLSIMSKHKSSMQLQALTTMMKLLSLEGKYPVDYRENQEYYFPVQKLRPIVLELLSSECSRENLIARFQEFTAYEDVLYYVWKLLPTIVLNKKQPNETFIKNFLSLLDKIPVPKQGVGNKDNWEFVLCGKEGGPDFVQNTDHLHKWLNRVWSAVIRWEHSPATHQQLLVVLLERILPHLDKPLLLTDYLMDSLDMGGAVSLLALQGIFILIKNHNLEYPNIYGKLYSMFEPEIFHTKYKARLFYLSDMFLSSTHLSEHLVAAFAKRLARLTLVAPPQDIHIILMFIGNLVLRHPGLKRLFNHPTGGEVSLDPYIMEERDPLKSQAIESSLWELHALQNHILPSIATAAKFINMPLPSVEWDMSKILENSADDIFEKEMKKKVKEITLTFDRPQSLTLSRGERVTQYWTLT